MPNSFRIKSDLGTDKVLQVKLEQNFDSLEILSMSINPEQEYLRTCAQFGVVCGRVFVNNGFGLPNARISIFVPLEQQDETNSIISVLYPYKDFTTVNEDGYKYNLLPYTPSHSAHVPVGTFPERIDALIDNSVVEVYDKYYKYTVKTNDAGDFMIFGVPVGQHDLFMQIDLSDIGQFSLTPQDLIRLGLATEDQVDGTRFKFSENYSELPQIITVTKTIQVEPFYGEPEVCNYSITRTDYDLTTIAKLKLQPTSIFMGSLISIDDKKKIGNSFSGSNCKVKSKAGQLCDMTTGPGQIVAIRQTIFSDDNGRPILEEFRLNNDGKVIDEDGTWVLEVPMNLNYVYTDEYGQQRISNNPDLGVPTKGKYRFKIKWLQSPQLSDEVKRAYYLLPNIKERGWGNSNTDPIDSESNVSTLTISQSPITNTEGNPLSQTIYVDLPSETVYRLSFIENIQNLVVTDPNGVQLNGTTLRTEGTYIFTFEVEDLNNPYTIDFDNVPIDLFLLQSSYAFSLDWNEYANPTEAINCVDTFYEMVYNKVYTVSQLIDRYQSNRFAGNTLIIKKITDSNCEGTYNTFPTNDAIYRVDVLFVIISFFLDFFKFLTIPTMLILHVLAFVLTNIFYPFLILFIAFLGYLAVSFFIDAGAALASPVPQVALGITFIAKGVFLIGVGVVIAIYANRLKEASKKLINIGLPLVLYTDDGCERCNCQTEYGGIDQTEDDPQSLDASSLDDAAASIINVPLYDPQTSLLIDVTSTNPYNGYTPEELQNVGQVWAGYSSYGQGAHYTLKRFPWVPTANGYFFTTNLPPAELYNLFNTKSKYFNNVAGFGNGNILGYNQIKVNWIPEANNPVNRFHHDSVMVLVLDKNKISSFQSGQMVTFQDSAQSGDVNFEVTTGNTVVPSQITVSYANPDEPDTNSYPPLTTNYVIPNQFTSGNSSTTGITNPFPVDIEYFQVITGMTIGQFASSANPDANDFSFGVRYLQRLNGSNIQNRRLRYLRLDVNNTGECSSCYDTTHIKDSGFSYLYNEDDLEKTAITNYDDYGILILMRGVDPNSPRIPQQVDLSRIFGYDNYDWSNGLTVSGEFKMNVPIKGDARPFSHLTETIPNYISNNVFYNSYVFDYGNDFVTTGKTNLPFYYSNIDNGGEYLITNDDTNTSLAYLDSNDYNYYRDTNPINSIYRIRSSNSGCNGSLPDGNNGDNYANAFTRIFATPYANSINAVQNGCGAQVGECLTDMRDNTCLSQTFQNITGYYGDESVAGGSMMGMLLMHQYQYNDRVFFNRAQSYDNGKYGSPIYISPSYLLHVEQSETTGIDPSWQLTSNRQVFRSDRLPTSTNVQKNGKNHYLLHQNSTFAIFKVSDAGSQQALINVTNSPTTNNESTQYFFGDNPVIQSLSDCSKAVPLECYDIDSNGQPIINPNCDQLMDPDGKEKYFLKGNGCYNLVSKPFKTIPKDIKSVVEWITRLKMNLAACFEIISHTFNNQYVNGTLYTYPFRNVRVFDSNNEPFSLYCKDLVILHPSNNFYYRSSPFSTTSLTNINDGYFIGKTNSFGEDGVGNKKYLGAPTTILDLGPRDSFLQELVYSDDYDGYIVAKLKSTSFQEVNDILNIFILSRLINTSFLQQLIPISDDPNEGQSDPTIKALFSNTRWRDDGVTLVPGFIDGDYSQMIAINSEFGIQEFSPESYNASSLYFSNADEFPYFGLFMKGNNQDRDYITPRRTIWNENAPIPPSQYDFTNIPVNSQEVPYYLWHFTGLNNSDPDTIFGTQSNNYATTYPDSSGEFSSKFFSFKYQELDRINSGSRYVQVDGNNSFYYKGYIINYDSNGNPTEVKPANNYSQTTLTNSPYYFYFGLKKGASALDKFFIKYVDTNIIIE